MSSTTLPVSWLVVTELEVVPAPLDPGAVPHSNFARWTTRVLNSVGQLVAASADRQDAIAQALAICQATEQPYNSATWSHA
jgi:hypothetical protein